MHLQVLISTMNKKGNELISKMRIDSDAVVVNQCNQTNTETFQKNNSHIKWIDSLDRGLSRSRNLALKNATSEICLLSDDDLEYIDGYEKLITSQFEKFPEADIITFQVEGVEEVFKEYSSKVSKLNYLTSMKVASVEIAFRLESINRAGINFNESFGAGSKYLMGEENIFLFNCLKHNLKIIYVPLKIANLHVSESTWFRGFNKDYFISKGAVFTEMSRLLSYLFILQFAIRKYKLYKDELTRLQAVKYMLKGRRQFLRERMQVNI